jgi:hypothetical protein
MRQRKLLLSLLVTLAAGLTSCTKTVLIEPYLGPAFHDRERDEAASKKRLAEFDRMCVFPTRQDPPRPALLPVWCAWTMQADKVIRANNALRRD